MENEDFILGYWESRGRAQPIRFLLEYLGVKYTQKQYTFAPETKAEWFEKDKKSLNMDYPNLPYIIDGSYKLSDSAAIMNYIPLRFKRPELLGRTIQEQGTVQQMMGLIADFRVPIRGLIFDENWEKNKESQLEKPRQQLQIFNTILGKHKWLVGDNLTIADFFFYEYLHIYRFWDAENLKKAQNVERFNKDFEALPNISTYLKSQAYKQYVSLFPKAVAKVQTVDYINQYNSQFN